MFTRTIMSNKKFLMYLPLLFSFSFASVQAVVFTEKPTDFTAFVEVSACFIEKEGQFLFLHSQDHKPLGNTWGIPGGKIEKNETALTALLREVKEETGIQLQPDTTKFIKTVYITNTGRTKASYVYHMYTAPYSGSSSVTIDPNEHKGYTWVTLSDALSMNLMDDEAECIAIAYPKAS